MLYFVLHVETGKEKDFRRMAERLVREAGTEGDFYLPQRTMEVRRRGETRKEQKPLFPGYIFWCTSDWNPDVVWVWRQVPGFLRVLGKRGQPEALSEEDLFIVQHLLGFGETLGVSRVEFDPDDRIVVSSGPLKGLEGHIVRVDKRKKRAKVRLDLYESTFVIDFGFELLQTTKKGAS